ncbi:TOPRIM nucleotidyl transferase/hydrolase domain-containing protein, partial [Caldicellulosiruptor sp. F32]|uniref:TOPRIM nucleotidyl transferase/hydrolase domain-containing protein n=1 Tax=Caldicellulosiruptor sp. F32 TaxID=1214564 RepID=UPI001ED99947
YQDNPSSFFDLNMQNISVINVGGKDSIPKYFKFAAKILGNKKVVAMIDKDPDFETSFKPKLKELIKEVFNEDTEDFKRYGIFILSKGEFEHYYKKEIIKKFLESVIITNIENDENVLRIQDEEKKQQVIEKMKEQKFSILEEQIKQLEPNSKLSKAYEGLFEKFLEGWTKPAIAFKLTKYLLKNKGFENEIFEILREIIHYLRQNEIQ